MGGSISITSSNVNILQDQSVLHQTINSPTQQPSLAELLKLLDAVKAELPALPEEVRARVSSKVDEAAHQITQKQPDKAKALDSLKNAGAILAEMPKTVTAAVTVGHLLGQIAIYCAKLFSM